MSSKAPRLLARRTLNLLFLFRFHRSFTIGTDKKSFSTRVEVFPFSESINYAVWNSLFFFTSWEVVAGDTLEIPLVLFK